MRIPWRTLLVWLVPLAAFAFALFTLSVVQLARVRWG
jgi:hypothetical protein